MIQSLLIMHTEILTEFQMQVCIGSLLGDSSLSRPKNGRNYHLSCYHSEKQINWLKMKHEWLSPLSRPIQMCSYMDKRDGKIRTGARFHTISAPCFTELADLLYHNKRKMITNALLKNFLHPVALACLICDDGSWDRAGIQIATKQFTHQDNQRLSRHLNATFGIQSVVRQTGKYWNIRLPALSVPIVFDLCHEWIPETLFYKFGGENYIPTIYHGKLTCVCAGCSKPFLFYPSSHQKFCSRECAQRGKPTGYTTRTLKKICPVCKNEFMPYIKKQERCKKCTDLRENSIPCCVCGNPVFKRNAVTCSRSCDVVLGHHHRT